MKKSSRNSGLMTSSASSLSLSNGRIKQGQQDESNMKILRDLSHLPVNRHCFDCGQRGPTYVNVTIGSFVCMTCSGLLRGITPPHRVKSISMANFTSDEIEILKSRGNEYCRKVWLATSSPKDIHLGSENDPDRINTLKSLLSSKYEQKRFYVDPSKLPKSELAALQEQTTLALQQSNHVQKSPSLSSTDSSSPSPIMNNLRNTHHPSRLVNSITLPDIKPLSSLLGPENADLSTFNMPNGQQNKLNNQYPAPINFINNLVSTQNQNKFMNGHANNNNNGNGHGQWESESEASMASNDNNEFVANFADFDDAFSNNSSNCNGFSNGGEHGSNLFSNNTNGLAPHSQQKVTNGNGIPFTNMTMQQPMMPNGGGNTFHNHNGHSGGEFPLATQSGSYLGDKYAALKDLDSIFKQNSSGDGIGNGTGTSGLPNSASVPTNLSSSTNETGWFSTCPNQNPNPFSQALAPSNGWSTMSATNSNGALRNGANPQNPFASNCWQSNALSNGTNSVFHTSSSHNNFTSMMPPLAPVNVELNGTGSFPSHQRHVKAFNPFVAPPRANPNNPFM